MTSDHDWITLTANTSQRCCKQNMNNNPLQWKEIPLQHFRFPQHVEGSLQYIWSDHTHELPAPGENVHMTWVIKLHYTYTIGILWFQGSRNVGKTLGTPRIQYRMSETVQLGSGDMQSTACHGTSKKEIMHMLNRCWLLRFKHLI